MTSLIGKITPFGPARWLRALRGRFTPVPTRFVHFPAPYTIGDPDRGADLVAGVFDFAGYRIDAPGRALFDLPAQGDAFDEAAQGFGWLDDLAACGLPDARHKAQDWVMGWVEASREGPGTKDRIDLAGRRLLRLALHAETLVEGLNAQQTRRLIRRMDQQARFLHRHWSQCAPGLPRFEALTGLAFAGLCLEHGRPNLTAALRGIEQTCRHWISADGAIPSRNPEELLRVFCLLIWTRAALAEQNQTPGRELSDAIARIAPTLRALRHADGALARFHGGGVGPAGWLDFGLAQSEVRSLDTDLTPMGYARLSALRTSVVIDAAPPAPPVHSQLAHASTLAFELTSGRRPIVVNCGSGAGLERQWQRMGRETSAHSTVTLRDLSSARFGSPRRFLGATLREPLEDAPHKVGVELFESMRGRGVECWHDGFYASHGLIHSRQLALSFDGRVLAGQDTMAAIEPADHVRFTAAQGGPAGLPVFMRFHLHPDVGVIAAAGGQIVTLALASGENWVFRHDGHLTLSIEKSRYFEHGKLQPTDTKQLVLHGRMLKPALQVNWSLAKDDETPQGIRDIGSDELSD